MTAVFGVSQTHLQLGPLGLLACFAAFIRGVPKRAFPCLPLWRRVRGKHLLTRLDCRPTLGRKLLATHAQVLIRQRHIGMLGAGGIDQRSWPIHGHRVVATVFLHRNLIWSGRPGSSRAGRETRSRRRPRS